MSRTILNLALCAVCVTAPVVASAAVINVDLGAGQFFSDAQVIQPGTTIEYAFNVTDPLQIGAFALSATGNNDGGDVNQITFGFTAPPVNNFSTVTIDNDTAFGGGFLPGGVFAAGDAFSIFFGDGVINPASVTLSFATTAISAIPLPAAGFMLIAAMAGLGVAGARRKRAAV